MAVRKSREQLETELRLLRNRRLSDGWASVANSAVRWGGAVGITYFAYKAVESLAGRETGASLLVELVSDFKLNIVFPWLVAIGGAVFGLLQRYLRRTTIQRLHRRIHELEELVDPGRSSSNLTSTGDTHPEDRL